MNQSKSKILLSEIDFTNLYYEILSSKIPDLILLEIKDLEIKTTDNDGNERCHFLTNTFAEYNYEPSEIDEIMERYTNSSIEIYSNKTTIDIDGILPIIKDRRFFDEAISLSENLAYKPYNTELYIFYAEDRNKNISYLTKEELKELNLNLDSVQDLALNNLEALLRIERNGDEGIYMLIAGGNYESSIVLLDIWYKENFPVSGDIIIAIPSRDLLFVTGSDDKEKIDILKSRIQEINETGDHVVSDKLFILQDSKFEIWDEN